MPLVWRSKQAIYYTLAAVSSLSGLEVYETISTVAALLLGMAALGFFLVARELLRAPPWAALAAMAVVGLDRMVLHTVMHPYFNQTWGFFAMPFAMVLGWWVVRERTRGGIALLVLFLAVLGLAYPLALAIPLLPLAIVLWPEVRRLRPRGLWKGPRSLLWMVPAVFAGLFVLSVPPLKGVVEKIQSANAVVLNPFHSLQNWGGDLLGYFPEPHFLAMNTYVALAFMAGPLVYAARLALRDLDEALRRALVGLLLFTLVFLVWFRIRKYGYYFHFKLLAFVGPILLTIAIAGAAKVRPRARRRDRRRRAGHDGHERRSARSRIDVRRAPQERPAAAGGRPAAPAGAVGAVGHRSAGAELGGVHDLRPAAVCSQRPLLGTNYPHVQVSRKADLHDHEVRRRRGRPTPRGSRCCGCRPTRCGRPARTSRAAIAAHRRWWRPSRRSTPAAVEWRPQGGRHSRGSSVISGPPGLDDGTSHRLPSRAGASGG